MSHQTISEIQTPSSLSKLWSKMGLTAAARDRQEVVDIFNQQWRIFEKWRIQSHLQYREKGKPVTPAVQQLTGEKIVKKWPILGKILTEIGTSDFSAELSKNQAQNLIYTLSIKIATDEIDDEESAEAKPEPPAPAPPVKLDLNTIAELTPVQAVKIIRKLNQPRSTPIKVTDLHVGKIAQLMRKLEITNAKLYKKFLNALYIVAGERPPVSESVDLTEYNIKENYQKFLSES